MSAYQLTPAADADLEEIWQHVALASGRNSAERLEDELHAAMKRLASAPGIGHLREDLADEELMFYPVYRYLIIYRPKAKPLQVVRVLHGARDVGAILASGSDR